MSYIFTDADFYNEQINDSLNLSLQEVLSDKSKEISFEYFKSVTEVIYKYTGNYRKKDFSKEDNNFHLIKDCIHIAKYHFNIGVTEKSINKIIVPIIIIDFFSQKFELLNMNQINDEVKTLFSTLLNSLSINIGIPADAPYNEKKLFEVYSEAKKINDYNKVISIMDNLKYHSRVFDTFEYSWKIIIQYIDFLDREIILETLIKENNFEKIEIILSSINITRIFKDILQNSNYYLIIRSSKYFFDNLEEQFAKKNRLQELPDYTCFLADLFSNKKLLFSNYIENLHLNYCQSYCYLVGWLLSRRTEFTYIFLEHMCFYGNQANAFSLGFNLHLNKNTDPDIIPEIERYFFDKEIKTNSPINYYSGYIDLLTYYYANKYSAKTEFLKELNSCSKIIEDIQSSWKFEDLQKNWIRLFYLSLATIYTDFFFTDEEIKKNIPVLYDKRNILIQGKENIDVITAMLKNHSQYLKIKLKSSIDEHFIELNN